MDMFQLGQGVPVSQYLNTTEAPALAISAPELATTIKALPKGLIKEDPTIANAYEEVKNYVTYGVFDEDFMNRFRKKNKVPKNDKRITDPINYVNVLDKGGLSVVEIDGNLWVNPWMPGYDEGWVDDEQDDETTKRVFTTIYKHIAKDKSANGAKLRKMIRDRIGIDIN
jgi:hypothetical protein